MDHVEAYVRLCEAASLHESNLDGYLSLVGEPNRNGDFAKRVRRMDVANSQLKRGAINQQQLDQIHRDVNRNNPSEVSIPKLGSNVMSKYTGARPNKIKSPMKPSDFGSPGSSYRHSANVDANTAEKLKRHLTIARTTDNYNDYQQHRKQLLKMIGAPSDATVLPDAAVHNKTHFNANVVRTNPNAAVATARDKLYHTSRAKNIQALVPQYRASDGALYPEKRVYFGTGSAMTRNGGQPDPTVNVYQYKGAGTLKADPELNSTGTKPGAFYLATNRRLPVKQVKQ